MILVLEFTMEYFTNSRKEIPGRLIENVFSTFARGTIISILLGKIFKRNIFGVENLNFYGVKLKT